MALASAYVLPTNRIPDLFTQIRDAQAPQVFTHQLLKDWGFKSTNDRPFIPLLKALGFLSSDGKPTQRYHGYRDHSRSKSVMAQALREAYEDLFLIKERPTASDRTAIEGKFKSFHNVSDNLAVLMTKTFLALLPLADFSNPVGPLLKPKAAEPIDESETKTHLTPSISSPPGLHYNIQIHLPATKDVEVYNAIFKSLREHLLQ